MSKEDYKYDIVFSFAGEDRNFVELIVSFIKKTDIKYFYDEDRMTDLWGKDLAIEFDNIFQKEARYCVIVISQYYKEKIWTNHELKSALARAITERDKEYVLPIRLDDTEIPGIRPTTAYIDARKETPKIIFERILDKLNKSWLFEKRELTDSNEVTFIPKIRRTISDLERKKFLKTSFNEINNFFENALTKLKKSNQHIETDFDQITSSKFVATVYVEGELKAQCKIWIGGLGGSENSISFFEGTRGLDINNDNSLNDSATVNDDGSEIFFNILGSAFGYLEGLENINLKQASAKDVAKYYWARLVNYLRY